ncbi:MAG: response regulator [Chromatiaceae bacterium]|nr:response regulator [Gammaproteobacteria bacterium]MCP5300059.1 response regulator [Chromatiaceae bacterium]MCP5422131.1 response regulator [Chromatiaceae bacterium]
MAKILIVDDSPTELHVLTKILRQGGHEALTASDGESGIAAAQTQAPDAILMDVVMPGINGFQATRKLSRDPKTQHIPVLMVTTKDQETDREWGMRQGAKGYLVKPVDGRELLQKLGELLR